MSDPSQGGAPPPRRAPTRGDSRAPVTTITVLGLAAVAVIAGFVILHSVTRRPAAGEAGAGAPAASVTASAAPPTSAAATTSTAAATTTTIGTTTTAPGPAKTDAVVVVANASGVGGSATKMTAQLAANGYTTAPVANATGPRLDHSVIYYVPTDPAAQGVARLLAAQIPSAQTLPLPNPPPLDRPLKATVVLMLGRDAAGRPLAQLQTG